jgi:regulator of sigma E protease
MASAIIADSAADKAGFLPHDEIIAIDGEKIRRFEDIRRVVMVALDTPLEFVVIRNNEEVTLEAIPTKQEITDRFGFTHSRGQLGIIGPNDGIGIKAITKVGNVAVNDPVEIRTALLNAMDKQSVIELGEGENQTKYIINPLRTLNEGLNSPDTESLEANALVLADRTGEFVLKHGVGHGISAALTETWRITQSTLKALGQMFTGTRSATELGGIVRIGAIAGDMAQAGILALITFTALLSINLGLINLFPIPMLDGGHLVFYAAEALKGKPISDRTQDYAFRFGFAILIGMMLFANLNDLFQMFIKD